MSERRPFSVLFLAAYPSINGPLPKLTPLLVDELRRLGCHVELSGWSRHHEGETVAEKLGGRLQDLAAVAGRLRRAARAGGPFDVMYVQTTHDEAALLRDLPLFELTEPLGTRRVVHFHGSMVDEVVAPGRPLFTRGSRWLVGRCGAVMVLSEEERERWQECCPGARFETVLNPFVPPAGAASAPPRPPLDGRPAELLFVGRFIPSKGIFDLLEAMPAVLARRPCRLRMAGFGSHEGRIHETIDRLGLAGRVEVVGYVSGDDLDRLYAESDALVLPTYFGEGFPTVFPEAMSFGLPIVTTYTRGAADLLEEGAQALFVPARDPAVLADRLLDLLGDDRLRAKMGEAERRRVLDFAPAAVVPRYLDIMQSVVAEAAAAARKRRDEGDTAVRGVARLPERAATDDRLAPVDGGALSETSAPTRGGPGTVRVVDVDVALADVETAARWVLRASAADEAGRSTAGAEGAPAGSRTVPTSCGRSVCAANVHVVMEAHDDPSFRTAVEGADLTVADGRPVVWAGRMLGVREMRQVRGQDLMLAVCGAAAGEGVPIGLYGSDEETLERLSEELSRMLPGLEVAYVHAPPFRATTEEEDAAEVEAIGASGARILFVGLGCPKQERWMAAHRERLDLVMLGVGAAFDMIAGTVPVAPRWAQRMGLEWTHRLLHEPRRLWRRYARHNGRFVALVLAQRVAGLLRGHGREGGR